MAICESSKEETGFRIPFISDLIDKLKKNDTEEAASADEDEDDGLNLESLPIISLDEVKKHTAADSIWVTYEGLVYDVTSFVEHHPGGKEL